MSWLALGFVILFIGLFVLSRLANANPKSVVKTGKWVFLSLLGLLVFVLLFRGQIQFLWLAFLGLLPWIGRFRQAQRIWKMFRGPSPGRVSEVKSRYLHMELNQDTGDMAGHVLEGTFEGRELSDLSFTQCLDLLTETSSDPQSVQLLEAYLDRMHTQAWEEFRNPKGEGEATGASSTNGPMGRSEALEVLGLSEGASEEEIKTAHRKLMKSAHPDHGGSDYLAAKINQAKDILLGN